MSVYGSDKTMRDFIRHTDDSLFSVYADQRAQNISTKEKLDVIRKYAKTKIKTYFSCLKVETTEKENRIRAYKAYGNKIGLNLFEEKKLLNKESIERMIIELDLEDDFLEFCKKLFFNEDKYDGNSNIYFICDGNGLVKIGHAKNVKKRLAQLQTGTGSKLYIFGILPDMHKKLERELHAEFSDYKVGGEWFKFIGPVREYAESYLTKTIK